MAPKQPPRGPSRLPGFLARTPGKGTVEPAFRGTGSPQLRVVGARPAPEPPAAPPPAPAAPPLDPARITAEVAERIGSAVEVLRLCAERMAAEARSDALEVAFLVARRIVEAELQTSSEALVGLVRAAVRRLGEARKIVVRLSPPDAEAVNALLASRGAATLSGIATAHVEVMPDSALERGDCVVEGDLGSVDGRLSTRLEELRRALEDAALEEVS